MVKVNLALQGGGAHGAFTWGVLDRLLQEDTVEIAGLSGTSAGALNGAALKSGMVSGGREGARDKLDWLWEKIAGVDHDAMPDWIKAWLPDPLTVSRAIEYSPAYVIGEATSRMMSPYAAGPLYSNPLEPIVRELDFDQVCARGGPALFICATHVREGKVRIFQNNQIDAKAIMASACLPTMFQAVETKDPLTGEMAAFWDGGYTGNPALFPLFNKELPDDIIVININPLKRDKLPVTPPEIQNRINEISFNSSLLREMRAISFVQKLHAEGHVAPEAMKVPRMHMIADDRLMNDLSVATKIVPVPSVIAQLKQAGQEAAGLFLDAHHDDLGRRQSVDLEAMFG